MWTNRVLMCGIDILLCLWAVYLFFFYFDIFFVRKKKRCLSVIGITLFMVWQFGITTIISFPAYINIAVTIMFTFLAVMMTYEGRWWNKGVFVITFNAIWMLMETLCNYILITYWPQYAAVRQVGSFVSKIFFNAVILALKKVFTDDDIKELPVRYSILLVLIPTGSIYIMNNIFMLGFTNNNGRTRINSTFTVLILLGMNILIFYVYMKLADDLRLRRMAAVYEQQLLKTRDNRLKSTKSDAENHGVGLASVYRAVAKYHGSVVIEDSEPGKFKIRIVLYSNVQE